MTHTPLKWPAALALIALLGTLAMPAVAGEKVPFADAPEAVRQTVEREVGRAVRTLELETFDGQTAYEAEYEVDDVDRGLWVAEDGAVLARSVEIRVRELPKAVVDAVLAKYPGAELEEAERIEMASPAGTATQPAEVRYEVEIEIERNGRDIERELIVTADGDILSDELDD
ncbi:MAG: hypothetical protein AAF586_03100 [Planctomycetota bacterium]